MSASLAQFFSAREVRMVEITPGVAAPIDFGDPAYEHTATRRRAGLFDFSFMGAVDIRGKESVYFLQRLQTRDLSGLPCGRLAYTLLLRENGTVLNDATVWSVGPEHYRLFIGRRADLSHVRSTAANFRVEINECSDRLAVLAVQGPAATEVVSACLGDPVRLPYFGFASARFGGEPCAIARLGYSGEHGFEIVVAANLGVALWTALLDAGRGAGIAECGFAAADSLRIEAGHILFMRELAQDVYPDELGLERLVRRHGTSALGAAALRARPPGPRRRLTGLLPVSRGPIAADRLRRALEVTDWAAGPGTAIMTSACFSPTFARPLALGYVSVEDRYPGTRVRLQDGLGAVVARRPFYDPGKSLPRAG